LTFQLVKECITLGSFGARLWNKEGAYMNKWLVISLLCILFTFIGCSNNRMVGEKPPKALIKIGNETYETTLGSYCWNGSCVDTAGPVELLEGKKPIKVKPGENVTFVMDYEQKPNKFHIVQKIENRETKVVVEDNRFVAPKEKGIYYYSYGVWWMDEKEANLSHGDASYAFALEVN
jgi:uncharacterized lipoprotein NlpE involved in copper resistance